jgi:hypothetical protein
VRLEIKNSHENYFCQQGHYIKKLLSFKMTYFFVMEGKNPWFYNKKKPKAQVWVLIKAIISFLNHVVLACVMNQSRGHWLLSHALLHFL